VDLYGRNWTKWWSRNSLWLPYWKNRNALLSIYKGSCVSKLEVLSQYDFALCFENMQMQGYITEKIFDCFYAGTVPVYWGAQDIAKYIPANSFIDFKNFQNTRELKNHLQQMSLAEILEYKQAARDFLISPAGMSFYNSLTEIIEKSYVH
jgi:hypothetical protein